MYTYVLSAMQCMHRYVCTISHAIDSEYGCHKLCTDIPFKQNNDIRVNGKNPLTPTGGRKGGVDEYE